MITIREITREFTAIMFISTKFMTMRLIMRELIDTLQSITELIVY